MTKTAVQASTTFTFNNSAAKGRKFVADMSKMMLRAYNAEAENCVLTVKAGNGEPPGSDWNAPATRHRDSGHDRSEH